VSAEFLVAGFTVELVPKLGVAPVNKTAAANAHAEIRLRQVFKVLMSVLLCVCVTAPASVRNDGSHYKERLWLMSYPEV
jgi:hypothetical protein